MTSWANKISNNTKAILASSLVVSQTAAAATLSASITQALQSPILKTLVTGACVALGILEAFKIWKAMFGGGGDVWPNVLALLGWILLALYWVDMVTALVNTFGSF
jgi:hypothetical protein